MCPECPPTRPTKYWSDRCEFHIACSTPQLSDRLTSHPPHLLSCFSDKCVPGAVQTAPVTRLLLQHWRGVYGWDVCGTSGLQAQVPEVPDHLRGGSRHTTCALASPALEQRQCERFCSTACKEGRPTVHPRLLGTTLPDWGLPSCLGFGQVPDKGSGFVRPPAAHFSTQDHESGAAVPPVELRVSDLLAPPCCEGCAADVSATGVRSPIPTKWRHHGGVHGKLGAVEQGQPVHHDFKSSDCLLGWALPDPCPGL